MVISEIVLGSNPMLSACLCLCRDWRSVMVFSVFIQRASYFNSKWD